MFGLLSKVKERTKERKIASENPPLPFLYLRPCRFFNHCFSFFYAFSFTNVQVSDCVCIPRVVSKRSTLAVVSMLGKHHQRLELLSSLEHESTVIIETLQTNKQTNMSLMSGTL
jgi:hypothetical protein